MAKLERVHQKIFASSAPVQDVGVIGSLHDGNPTQATTIQDIQSLPAFEEGLRGVVIGENSPILEEDNAFYKLVTHQLAYLLQQGVSEWDPSTAYFKNSVCSKSGLFFISQVDENIGNDPFDENDNWYLISGMIRGDRRISDNYEVSINDHDCILLVDASAGNTNPSDPDYGAMDGMIVFLPNKSDLPRGFRVTIKDVGYWATQEASGDGAMSFFPDKSFQTFPLNVIPGKFDYLHLTPSRIDSYRETYENFNTPMKLIRKSLNITLWYDGDRWWSDARPVEDYVFNPARGGRFVNLMVPSYFGGDVDGRTFFGTRGSEVRLPKASSSRGKKFGVFTDTDITNSPGQNVGIRAYAGDLISYGTNTADCFLWIPDRYSEFICDGEKWIAIVFQQARSTT